ncbi:hypothetical protein PAXRUDRAFT_658882 [Paxillus rubicundulus Ve08.2h10]|uniref:Uncharacterized protein n=1 Tax=Paxillus rubicundulus Ve08.2h10 TaxID=930991 RepID=A0A0D0DXA0_9AGAM|nr:hypothetical protein PAXRUDRAFT_658882 [Paxillus rubicundulus Ve08.2h10]
MGKTQIVYLKSGPGARELIDKALPSSLDSASCPCSLLVTSSRSILAFIRFSQVQQPEARGSCSGLMSKEIPWLILSTEDVGYNHSSQVTLTDLQRHADSTLVLSLQVAGQPMESMMSFDQLIYLGQMHASMHRKYGIRLTS